MNTYNRDRSYFQSLRDNGVNIESYNIDLEYNNVVDYLNNVAVPTINDIVDGALPGIIDSANFYLRNIGDGTTAWSTLDQMLNDYSLSFSKLEKSEPGSLLVSDRFGEIVAVSADIAEQVLVSQEDSSPVWGKIRTNNIGDRGVTGIDIVDGSIGEEHLKEEITTIIINDGTVTGGDFADLSITADKFLNASIISSKLGVVNNRLPANENLFKRGDVRKQYIKNNVVTPDKIKAATVTESLFNRLQCITRGKIAPNTIDNTWLTPQENGSDTGAFVSATLAQNFKLTRGKLITNANPANQSLWLTAYDFDIEVLQAFSRKGCTSDY